MSVFEAAGGAGGNAALGLAAASVNWARTPPLSAAGAMTGLPGPRRARQAGSDAGGVEAPLQWTPQLYAFTG